jgi:hypothetical protein
MKIELTDDEATTVLVALDNYRDQKEMAWASDGFLSDQQDAGSAEWIWQKIMGAREVDRIEQAPGSTSASVDPFDLSGYDNMGND